jgi:DNA-binding sugar fermentation-stimulating protein
MKGPKIFTPNYRTHKEFGKALVKAKEAGVPITNYGITMAKLSGILDKIQLPE